MKNPSRLLRVMGVAALVIGLLAATMAPAMAQDDDDVTGELDFLDTIIDAEEAGFLAGNNTIFYPWVANDDDFGLGSADTSISIQNLEDRDTIISIFVGDGEGGYELVTSAYLAAFAAKTFHAEALGIEEGDGAPVMVISFNESEFTEFPGFEVPDGTIALVETPVILSNPVADDDDDGENDGGDFTQVVACVVNYHTAAQPNLGQPYGYVAAVDHTFVGDEGDVELVAGELFIHAFTQQELQDTLNAANEDNDAELINPFAGLNNDGDCFDVLEAETMTIDDSVAIGGVAKQGVDGESLPTTTGDDTAVSGYNAISGVEIAYFDQWYLPIVQTNCGPGGCWDSMIRVANYDSLNNAVTIRFFPADDGSGSLQEGFQVQALVNGGDTWHVNLGDYVPDGWVGSAHILSDGAVFAMVDRYKVGYDMWITNTGSSADFENIAQVDNAQGQYALFAPHVLLDYFGWNTGINVANLANAENNINIQYFNLYGNATQVLNQRLAAHGMTYFYDPSVGAQDNNDQDVVTDPNAGVVGSAIIWSDLPVAAAVDATKYPETDPTGGPDLFQATSYNATANVFPWQAVPLVQKGSPSTGQGDTSGINIMNPNATATTANVYWVNPSGFQGDNFGTSSVTIPGFANGFVYTLWQHNLPNGFLGAAQVVADQPVAAVSANVNYEVDGDGSAIYNAFNPCGLYRVAGPCSFGDVFEPGGQSVTKYFIVDDGDDDAEVDDDDTPIQGVNFSIVNTSGAAFQRDAVTGPDGSAILTNVPVGTYELTINAAPEGYVVPDDFVETFTVNEGEDVVLVNRLAAETDGLTVTVVEAVIENGDDDDDDANGVNATLAQNTPDDVELTDNGLSGVDLVVYEVVGDDSSGEPVTGDQVATGTTGEGGTANFDLPADTYVVCIEDADGLAVDENGETVELSFERTEGDVTYVIEPCDEVTLGDDDDNGDDDNGDDNGTEVQQNGDDDDDGDDSASLTLGIFADPVASEGGLMVTTTIDNEVAADVAVVAFLLDDDDTCEDVDLTGTPDATGTTDETGTLSLTVEDGTYCVVADLDGDADFDADDVSGVADVVEGAGSIALNLTTGGNGGDTGGLAITTQVGGVAEANVLVGVVEGTCAAAGSNILDQGTTDASGMLTLSGFAAGDVCVVGDFDDSGTIGTVGDLGVDATVVVGVDTPVLLNSTPPPPEI